MRLSCFCFVQCSDWWEFGLAVLSSLERPFGTRPYVSAIAGAEHPSSGLVQKFSRVPKVLEFLES